MLLVCCACGCDCSTLCACYLDGNAHDKRMVSSIGDNVDGFVLGNCTIAEDALAAIPRKMQASSEPAECLGMWTQDPGPRSVDVCRGTPCCESAHGCPSWLLPGPKTPDLSPPRIHPADILGGPHQLDEVDLLVVAPWSAGGRLGEVDGDGQTFVRGDGCLWGHVVVQSALIPAQLVPT